MPNPYRENDQTSADCRNLRFEPLQRLRVDVAVARFLVAARDVVNCVSAEFGLGADTQGERGR